MSNTATYASDWIRRFDTAEERWCLTFNRWSDRNFVRAFFAAVSRLGNGVFWYTLMAALPLVYGMEGITRALQMLATGIAGVAIYKALKNRFVRERPYISHLRIRMGTPPLDRYSFPSGHTLHAVSFTILLVAYFPAVGLAVIPFAVCVALSRIVLGLHYPTDVVVGGVIGTALAVGSILMCG